MSKKVKQAMKLSLNKVINESVKYIFFVRKNNSSNDSLDNMKKKHLKIE